MKLFVDTSAWFALNSSTDQNHAAASDSHGSELGVPGKASDVTATRIIVMRETPEGHMEFAPSVLEAQPGETLRIVLRNEGQIDHEFLLATPEEISEHAAMMRDFPDMQHDEPNAIRLQPGASGDIIWKFGNSARLEFACLIPGHYHQRLSACPGRNSHFGNNRGGDQPAG